VPFIATFGLLCDGEPCTAKQRGSCNACFGDNGAAARAGVVRGASALLRCCGGALFAVVGVSGCTEDGVEPGETDAAGAPVDAAGPSESGFVETGPAGPDAAPRDATSSDTARLDVVAPDAADNDGDVGPPPPIDGGEPPPRDAGSIPPLDPECDLRGRWLVSQRYVAEAVSERQGAHTWFYLEVRHEGPNITVQRGLHCGYAVTPISALGGKVDCSGAWPSFLAKNSSTGRRGTFVKNGSACHLKLDPEYTPRGVTLPHYLDPARALPTASQPAQGSVPGWEDWDGDGNPGVTLNVSGLATGKIYSAQRERTAYEGDVPLASAKFKVPISIRTEHVVLGRMGPALLESPSSVSADASQHYAWLVRLADDQALGSDAEACLAVRALKGQLVPEGDL
jgi:hypothetical protein